MLNMRILIVICTVTDASKLLSELLFALSLGLFDSSLLLILLL